MTHDDISLRVRAHVGYVVRAVVLVGGGVVGDDEGISVHKGGLDGGTAHGPGENCREIGAWHLPPGSTCDSLSAAGAGPVSLSPCAEVSLLT